MEQNTKEAPTATGTVNAEDGSVTKIRPAAVPAKKQSTEKFIPTASKKQESWTFFSIANNFVVVIDQPIFSDNGTVMRDVRGNQLSDELVVRFKGRRYTTDNEVVANALMGQPSYGGDGRAEDCDSSKQFWLNRHPEDVLQDLSRRQRLLTQDPYEYEGEELAAV